MPRLEKKSDNPIVLRRRASADSPIAATISSLEALEIEEFDSARSGALVFGREGNWSLLETSAGVPAGWRLRIVGLSTRWNRCSARS